MWRDRAGFILAAAAIVVATFAVGGAPRWAACLSAAVAVASAGLFVTSRRVLPGRQPLLILLGLAGVFTLLQLIPLPAAITGLLSPVKRQLIVDNAAALGTQPGRLISLSMDPPATAIELAKLVGYFALAYACLRLAASRRRRLWLATTLVAIGAAMAATAFVHHVLGASELFGLYAPKYMGAPNYMAPLLNVNHLAGLMALLAPIALGLGFVLPRHLRPAAFAAVPPMVALGLLTRSRGGALALGLGLFATGLLLVLRRNRERPTTKRDTLSTTLPMVVIALCALVLLGIMSASGASKELLGTTADEISAPAGKFVAWRSAMNLLGTHTWTGVGRGAFEASFPRVHDTGRTFIYSHLENEYLQTATDWGVPAALVLAAAFVLLMLSAVRRCRAGPLEAGLFGGIIAIAMQNLVDFSFSLPGVAMPTIAACALLTGSGERLRSAPAVRERSFGRAAMLGMACLALILAASPYGRTARSETDEHQKARRDDGGLPVAVALRTFERHPSDYLAAGLLARALYRKRDPRAVRALNRALTLNPSAPGVHLLAARMLYDSQHRDQALVEYSLALERARRPAPLLDELLARFPDEDQALRGLPLAESSLWRVGAPLRHVGRPELVLRYGQSFVSRHSGNPHGMRYVAAAAGRLGRHELAIEYGQRALRMAPDADSVVTLGGALVVAKQPAEAVRIIDRFLERTSSSMTRKDRLRLLLALAPAQEAAGRFLDAAATLRKALPLTMQNRTQAAVLHRQLALLETALGNSHQAAWEQRRAAELSDPTPDD